MDKRIIKAMYSEAVSKEDVRPLMKGIRFEKDRCYASDTKILVVYNQGSEKQDGKTVNSDGEEIKGKYPLIDRVIPKEVSNRFLGSVPQLYRALAWWVKQKDSNTNDMLVIQDKAFIIPTLKRLLTIYHAASELGSCEIWLNADGRPAKLISPSLTSIIMPCALENVERIDEEREFDSLAVVSYANFINTFAIESNKPKEPTAEQFGWL